MAFTTPRTWVVAEVVTASIMNTHVRDNIRYLKGMDGAIALEDEISITSAVTRKVNLITTGANVRGFLGLNGGSQLFVDVNRDPTTGTFSDTAKSHARIQMDGSGTASTIVFGTASAANTVATERLRLTGAGSLGLNNASPGGQFEARPGGGTPGGFLVYSAPSATYASATTLVADGTGDAANGLWFVSHVKRTGSTFLQTAPTFVTTPGAGNSDTALFSDGGSNSLLLRLTSAGAIQLIRGVGSGSYEACFLLMWI